MSESVVRQIEAKLTAAFAPTTLTIRDDSHSHAGHAGAREQGGGHYDVTIVSAAFAGMSLVARHRAVYAALAEEMRGAIHALAIHASEPSQRG